MDAGFKVRVFRDGLRPRLNAGPMSVTHSAAAAVVMWLAALSKH